MTVFLTALIRPIVGLIVIFCIARPIARVIENKWPFLRVKL